MDTLCIKCKGRNWCGKPCKYNFINVSKLNNIEKKKDIFKIKNYKQDFLGTSPTVFIGKYNYPKVNIGIVSPQFQTVNAKSFDDPKSWSKEYSIKQIANKRRTLVNSTMRINSSFLEKVRDVSLSIKPVNIEIELKKKPKTNLTMDFINKPMGPNSVVKKAKIFDNIKINKFVSKYHYDFDLKSVEAINRLYFKGINENDITRMFSVGNFGIKKNRKIVPTRWSITAVDDNLGKNLIKKIKNFKIIDTFIILHDKLFGNHFTILLLPDNFGFELFETDDSLSFTHDFERYKGRKKYAFECAGGYYASRLGVLEYLNKIKKQAKIIIVRFVSKEYLIPLGVWVVREAVRKATKKEYYFNDKNEMLNKINNFFNKFKYFLKKSILWKEFNNQKKLNGFL